jgi:WD40 repeat protein
LPVTAAVVSEDLRTLFTSGKEGSIVKHDLISGKSQKVFYKHIPPKQQRENGKGKGKVPLFQQDVEGHLDEVWALALSLDGNWLASGGKDRRVGVWDVHGERWVKSIGKHKDSVSVRVLQPRARSYLILGARLWHSARVHSKGTHSTPRHLTVLSKSSLFRPRHLQLPAPQTEHSDTSKHSSDTRTKSRTSMRWERRRQSAVVDETKVCGSSRLRMKLS